MAVWTAPVNLPCSIPENLQLWKSVCCQKCVAVRTKFCKYAILSAHAPNWRTTSIPEINLRRCDKGLCADFCTVQLKRDGTRRRTGREAKGKLKNGVVNQYSSHYLGTWCIQHYYRWCAHLDCQQSTELRPPADLNGLVRFAERRNLVSAHVPSTFQTRSTAGLE